MNIVAIILSVLCLGFMSRGVLASSTPKDPVTKYERVEAPGESFGQLK